MKKMHLSLCLVLCLMMLTGCGAGTTNPTPLPVNKAIVISANKKLGFANLSSAITSIQVSFTLPANVVPTLVLASDGSFSTSETGLKSLKLNGTILEGSYIGNTVQFMLWPNDVGTTDLGLGEFARLTYETTSGAELTSSSIQPVLKVSGPGSRDISSQIESSVSIVTYQKP